MWVNSAAGVDRRMWWKHRLQYCVADRSNRLGGVKREWSEKLTTGMRQDAFTLKKSTGIKSSKTHFCKKASEHEDILYPHSSVLGWLPMMKVRNLEGEWSKME